MLLTSRLLPSPGVPEHHPLFTASLATGVPVRTEFDLAAAWDSRPVVLITGTNGKSTVTSLVALMGQRAGLATRAGGNLAPPALELLDFLEKLAPFASPALILRDPAPRMAR